MHRNGQAVLLYLGQDRQLYIDNSPGKHLCIFQGRYFQQSRGNDILSITQIPDTFDGGLVKSPPGTVVQGLEHHNDEEE